MIAVESKVTLSETASFDCQWQTKNCFEQKKYCLIGFKLLWYKINLSLKKLGLLLF